jgi:hypothetical protein
MVIHFVNVHCTDKIKIKFAFLNNGGCLNEKKFHGKICPA